jgi:hypothetical protein
MFTRNIYRLVRHCRIVLALVLVTTQLAAQTAEVVVVQKEIDDDHIIIARKSGERLLLEKWSLRFSPLGFEGRSYVADVSPLWVTIYLEDRDPIKWSIKENLGGRIAVPPREQDKKIISPSKQFVTLVQAALIFLDYKPGAVDGVITAETSAAIKAFQKSEQLPETGVPVKAVAVALATQLYRRYPDNDKMLELAGRLLATASDQQQVDGNRLDQPDLIESFIKGTFNGWNGETVFILDNGQVWQQSSYAYTYHYAYHPKAIILKTDGGYKLMVEGVSGSIFVKRIK